MFILDKISSLLKEKHFSQKDLCEHLGIKQQAFTNWKNGNNDSYKKHLPQIAEFLGVSVDYLLGKDEKKEKPIEGDGLSDNMKKLIEFAKKVPDDKVDLLLRVMQSIVEEN